MTNTFNSDFIFPEIFTRFDENASFAEIENHLQQRDKKLLCADALMAWANCMGGAKPTPSFGNVMAVIHSRLGVILPEDLSKLAKTYSEAKQ